MPQGTFDSHFAQSAEQHRQIQRVRSGIGESILRFLRSVGVGGTFRAEQLREHVARECNVAPGSADRVLRDIRQDGDVMYVVVDRAASLYKVLRFKDSAA